MAKYEGDTFNSQRVISKWHLLLLFTSRDFKKFPSLSKSNLLANHRTTFHATIISTEATKMCDSVDNVIRETLLVFGSKGKPNVRNFIGRR
jgi:hypothetical protein